MRGLDEGLYCVDGSFGRSPLGRRMTVVVLPSGRLAIHSAIRMEQADMAALERLGPVGAIIVPNTLHKADAPWYAGRYPDAIVLAPRKAVARLARRMRIDGTLEDDWPAELAAALDRLALGGVRVPEAAFCHRATRTLILTDLVFNLGVQFAGLSRLLLKLDDAYGRFGPARLFRWVVLRDKAALLASLRELEQWDYDRIVMSHGDIVETDGKQRMRGAFAPLGL